MSVGAMSLMHMAEIESVKNKELQPLNLLTLKPRQNLEWETQPDGKVVLLIPKFTNRLLVKWFVPMLAKPRIRLKLDERGSYVWARCDGNMTVAEIGEQMSATFNEPVETTYERIGKFVSRFVQDKFLVLEPAG
jgi:hypothetical protein